jgi:predicted amidohydrolase
MNATWKLACVQMDCRLADKDANLRVDADSFKLTL